MERMLNRCQRYISRALAVAVILIVAAVFALSTGMSSTRQAFGDVAEDTEPGSYTIGLVSGAAFSDENGRKLSFEVEDGVVVIEEPEKTVVEILELA